MIQICIYFVKVWVFGLISYFSSQNVQQLKLKHAGRSGAETHFLTLARSVVIIFMLE